MIIKNISLEDLEINKSNDRHGDLENEFAAINWLFYNKANHMKELAEHIIKSGKIFETPLVRFENNKYIVYDGNRRITCLKALNNPEICLNNSLKEYFISLKESFPNFKLEKVSCHVVIDINEINEILFLRHTGSQNGVGQSRWDDRMKENFQARTNKTDKKPIEDIIENELRINGYTFKNKLPRSILKRLFTKKNCNRIGFEIIKDNIKYILDRNEVIKTLNKIAYDASEQEINLPTIYSSDEQTNYLNKLAKLGFLITDSKIKSEIESIRNVNFKNVRPKSLSKRDTLIPQTIKFDAISEDFNKITNIIRELQWDLKLVKHENAISVMFRVLFELSIHYYANKNNIKFGNDAKLHVKAENIAKSMKDKNIITNEQLLNINKLCNGNNFLSTSTLNQYIHNHEFSASQSDMITLWDNLSYFILACLKTSTK